MISAEMELKRFNLHSSNCMGRMDDRTEVILEVKDRQDLRTALGYQLENPNTSPIFSKCTRFTIHARGPFLLEEGTRVEILSLLAWINSLPRLEELGLSFEPADGVDLIVRIDDLVEILRHAPKLALLQFDYAYDLHDNVFFRTYVQGEPADLISLLTQQANLKAFHLLDCRHQDPKANDFAPLVASVLALPTIQTINLAKMFKTAGEGEHAMILASQLGRSDPLLKLQLIGWPLHERHDNNVLPLLESLRNNNNALQELSLRSESMSTRVFLHERGIQLLSQVLLNNTSLVELDVSVNEKFSLIPLFEALKINTCLKVLELHWEPSNIHHRPLNPLPPSQDTNFLLEVLRDHNFSLHHVRLVANNQCIFHRGSPHDCAQFYCLLNRMGRARLFQQQRGITKRDWIVFMIDCRKGAEDSYYVDILFYLLSANPMLCDE
jgi:hypothetical protein